jgi:predicted dehydrogenase
MATDVTPEAVQQRNLSLWTTKWVSGYAGGPYATDLQLGLARKLGAAHHRRVDGHPGAGVFHAPGRPNVDPRRKLRHQKHYDLRAHHRRQRTLMRFGLAGLGWAARELDLPALNAVEGAVVVGGCDSSLEQCSRWEKAAGVPAYRSLEELVAAQRPEAIVVATPPDSHAELCMAAVGLGADVICEKPFVPTVEEADRVLAAADSAGRMVAVNHEFREVPIFKAIAERIGSAQAGGLVFCQIWQLMDVAPWQEPVAWRAAMPNRSLLEGSIHLLDLLLLLFEERPAAIYARLSSGLDAPPEADAIQLLTFEFEDNRLAQLTIDRLCPGGTRYVELRADCERESLRASLGGRALARVGIKRGQATGIRLDLAAGGIAWAERARKRRVLARAKREYAKQATTELFRQITAAFQDSREPPSSGREARDVLAVIEAAYRSADSGERVALDWDSRSAAA